MQKKSIPDVYLSLKLSILYQWPWKQRGKWEIIHSQANVKDRFHLQFQVGRVFVANATPQMCMCVSVKMLPMVLFMCICDSKAVSPAHMETANPPRELLWFKWPGASFRTKPSSNATCHRGFSGRAGVVWMFYSGLSLEESSIFVARLKSQRSLRQNSNMWPLLICFHLWVIESSRGNPPPRRPKWNSQLQNKSEVAETHHLQINESDMSARGLSQQCSSVTADVLLTGISCWINGWITLGDGWLCGWVIWWCDLLPDQEQPYRRHSYHHVCSLQSFKMAIWKQGKKPAKPNCS